MLTGVAVLERTESPLSSFPVTPPRLTTRRLVLRAIRDDDRDQIQRLAADRDIAATTMTIPHPYPEGAAESWIAHQREEFQAQKTIVFAIAEKESDLLIGTIALMVKQEDQRGELGYWLGVPYWNQGFISEAAAEVLRYAFATMQLRRVWALHFHTNPASGAVMRKLGMRHEGVLREHAVKWGEVVDYHCYGILREEWEAGVGG
jgi:RimJ/RimL family protein N-acetyltransferase